MIISKGIVLLMALFLLAGGLDARDGEEEERCQTFYLNSWILLYLLCLRCML